MIEQIMYFSLGACVAALAAIALLPALWRRALRLTRARLSATLPLTADEIAAQRDQLRAAHVVEIRRAEMERGRIDAALQAAKTDIGARITEIHAGRAVIAAKTETIAALQGDLDAARGTIAAHEDTIATLEHARDNLATNLSTSRIAHQAADQDAANMRHLAEQRQARIGELEMQTESQSVRLAEAANTVAGLRDDLAERTASLRETARALRDATNEVSLVQRKLAATEGLAEDRQRTIDDLQAERLRLIEEAGQISRERDAERIEKSAHARQVDALTRRIAEFETALAAARQSNNDVIRDLTRTVESLRRERREADDQSAALRLEKTQIETELLRMKRHAAADMNGTADPQDTAAAPPRKPAARSKVVRVQAGEPADISGKQPG